MSKGKAQETNNNAAAPEGVQYRENPAINAKIDDYIKNNPEHWQRIRSMPSERMARALVLNEVQKIERRDFRRDVMRELEADPKLKEACTTIANRSPENEREKVLFDLAARALRSKNSQQPQQSNGVGV